MLKEINKRNQAALRRAAAWRRWARKLPHNRVSRPVLRNERGQRIGYGPATPIPEPPIDPCFCRMVELPSGRVELAFAEKRIEAAYRLARHPKATEAEVVPLPLTEAEVLKLYQECAAM
jgi:hypothetical protein